jgi:hypothetical protein
MPGMVQPESAMAGEGRVPWSSKIANCLINIMWGTIVFPHDVNKYLKIFLSNIALLNI